MKKIFTSHPHSVGETYFQHLRFASCFGFNMIVGGIACLTHAVFPFVFKKTGSNYLLKMTENFVNRMPTCEDRVLKLSDCITQKARCPEASSINE
jgi:hypothetical protein